MRNELAEGFSDYILAGEPPMEEYFNQRKNATMSECPTCKCDGYEAVLPKLGAEARELVRQGVYSLYELEFPILGAHYVLYTNGGNPISDHKTFWLDLDGNTKGYNTEHIDMKVKRAVRP